MSSIILFLQNDVLPLHCATVLTEQLNRLNLYCAMQSFCSGQREVVFVTSGTICLDVGNGLPSPPPLLRVLLLLPISHTV